MIKTKNNIREGGRMIKTKNNIRKVIEGRNRGLT